jgi:hypothetical protein
VRDLGVAIYYGIMRDFLSYFWNIWCLRPGLLGRCKDAKRLEGLKVCPLGSPRNSETDRSWIALDQDLSRAVAEDLSRNPRIRLLIGLGLFVELGAVMRGCGDAVMLAKLENGKTIQPFRWGCGVSGCPAGSCLNAPERPGISFRSFDLSIGSRKTLREVEATL